MSIELSNGRRLVWNWSNFLREDVRPRIIDAATDTEICALEGHTDYVRGALELHDGRLLTWSNDRTLRIWHMSDGACDTVFREHRTWIANAMEPRPGLVLSWDGDGWIQVWSTASGQSRHEIPPPDLGSRNDVRDVLLANAERMLVLHERHVRLLDVPSFRQIVTLSLGEQDFYLLMEHLPPAHFLIHDHEQAAVHALDDGRLVAGFDLRGYETKLLALHDGRLLALHWWRGKRHVIDLWRPLSAERIATLEFDGERMTHVVERADGEVLLALEDYRCFLLGTQPLALHREAALVSDGINGFASFDPERPVIAEAGHEPRPLRALRARWLGARESGAIALLPDRHPTGVRLCDGRLLLRKGAWPGSGVDEPFELFDIHSGSYDEIPAAALEAFDPVAWRSLLDIESLHSRGNGLKRRMACLTGAPLEAIERVLAPLLAQQRSGERGLSFIPAEDGAIVCQQWQPEPAAWWIDRRPGSDAVEMLPLFDDRAGCELFADRPLIAPDGTVHVLREGRLVPLARPGEGGVVRVPPAYRDGFSNIRWCARDRILVRDFDGVAVYDTTDLSRSTRLEGGHGVANWGIHELHDGTLVAYSRSALRSWRGEDLAPLAELRDPVDWGPGREALVALRGMTGLAFCAGQYSMDTRVVLWNRNTELLVFGAHAFEVLDIRDLGDGWMASLDDDPGMEPGAGPIWRIWRIPEALRFGR
ncbi:MAG: hypothetical protein KIS79_04015 [Burkholderiales bacterium]|nr:hypothetical protein [Burkholderiales bacterium]